MTTLPRPEDVGYVFQGHIGSEEQAMLMQSIATLRAVAPASLIVVSTWESCEAAAGQVGADTVVLSADPGPLHGIRADGKTENNVNRQIVSTRAGLQQCDRRFAVKMRVDATLTSLGFLDLYAEYGEAWGSRRIIVPRLFTVDPTMFEHMPMHVSDWFQFGAIELLRRYWECPLMTAEQATWYGSHPYAQQSTHLDRRMHALFAVEQHLARCYAATLGLAVPAFHNDTRREVMLAHRELLGRHFVVADLEQIGLVFAKYDWANRSTFQDLNCIDFVDWVDLAAAVSGMPQIHSVRRTNRRRRKALTRTLYAVSRPLWPILRHPTAKSLVNRALRNLSTL